LKLSLPGSAASTIFLPFFENLLDMQLLVEYNIYLTKLNRMEIVIEHRIQETGDRSLSPRKRGTEDGGQRTDDRIGKPGNQGNRVQLSRITGHQGTGYQQTRESGCTKNGARFPTSHSTT
jgi:hypothetical protein